MDQPKLNHQASKESLGGRAMTGTSHDNHFPSMKTNVAPESMKANLGRRLKRGMSTTFASVSDQLSGALFNEVPAGTSMMPDVEEMKKRVRQKLAKKPYCVSEFYWEDGVCSRIAQHRQFEKVTLSVIILNALYMAIDADLNDSDSLHEAHITFQTCENIFCIFFTVELLIRFGAFKRKHNCLRDAWFVFDFALVFFMMAESWIMGYLLPLVGVTLSGGGMANASALRLLRLLRLARMSRMARLLRSVPELMVLMKGIMEASSSCYWTTVLLIIAMYIWGLALKLLSAGTDFGEKHFPTVPHGMYNLMMTGCFMKGFNLVMDDITSESILCSVIYMLFVLFAGVTVMKMLTGMLCKVVNAVAATEMEKMSLGAFRDELLDAMNSLGLYKLESDQTIHDLDIESLQISHSMFVTLLNCHKGIDSFRKIGVDVVGLVTAADFIFPSKDKATQQFAQGEQSPGQDDTMSDDRQTLSFADFMESILELRGSNNATVKDMVDLRRFVRSEMQTLEGKLGDKGAVQIPKGSSQLPVVHEYVANEEALGSDPFASGVSTTESTECGMASAQSQRMCDGSNQVQRPKETKAESILKDLRSLDQVQSIIDWSDLTTLRKASLCKLAFAEAIRDAAVDEALDAANAKEALISLITSRKSGSVRCTGDFVELKLGSGSRVAATVDIEYNGGMQVPKGTLGTVVLTEPKLLVDWDSVTTLDYALHMLEFTEVSADHIKSIALDVKAGMHVVAGSRVETEFVKLPEGQQGIIISVDEVNGAFVDFSEAGRHMIDRQQLATWRVKSERAALFRLLSSDCARASCSRLVQTI